MTQTSLNNTIRLLKKYSFIVILLFAATFLEVYWAMGSFSEKMSSSCLDCSLAEDICFMSLFTAFSLTVLFRILYFLKNQYVQITIQLLFLIGMWFLWNYSIFVERESSWSTYDFDEEIHYTLSFSVLPILVLSCITVFVFQYISKKYEPK
ncbi:hypothetical protein [Flavobacterium sp.]|uniref:hypothetical protein n=1 Tax=Flavobacterium sp. TaxID=239 RepID=UPI002ED922FA